ncbi:MAG: purine-nucleoside phosphorylase [Defluviitaleaceae bacterium]|nr:purine-nucleoside phosphorylase [Defluviitaleaceae bacterium]
MSIPTPHILAKEGEFAKTVLMPGDPLRAKFIAENYLDNTALVSQVRGMLAYTGTYKGKPVSVMGSGMGVPSMGIYSYELFNFYDVDNIVRIGSAGAISLDLDLGDIIMGIGACTDSNYCAVYGRAPGLYAPTASYGLMQKAMASAKELGLELIPGNILTSDVFYTDDNLEAAKAWQRLGILAVEMEAAALYTNAALAGKSGLCICTISDTLFTGKAMSAEARQTSFTQMMELALGIL